MRKRVFIIHGWDGYPQEGIFPWLKSELEAKGFVVFNPLMPNPLKPKIKSWVSFLKKQIGAPDKNTILFGHSMGAQAILRYLESLNEGENIGGVVFLAGWTHLTDKAYEIDEDVEIAKPWLKTPLSWDKIKSRSNNFIAIFSDNDPLVPLSDKEIFKDNLEAKIVIEHERKHFSGGSGIKKLPSALNAVLEVSEGN